MEALVAMTMTFAQGFALERLEGIDEGHGELLDWIEGWLESLEREGGRHDRCRGGTGTGRA